MKQKKAKMSLEKKHNLTGWAFLIPAALLIFIFCFYPMIQAIILSFTKKGSGFAGLANYQRILKDKTFQQCLFNTVFYFIIQVPVMLLLALGLAHLLNSPKIKGKSIFRTLIFLPCATSLVSYSMIFKSLFAQDGLVNNIILAPPVKGVRYHIPAFMVVFHRIIQKIHDKLREKCCIAIGIKRVCIHVHLDMLGICLWRNEISRIPHRAVHRDGLPCRCWFHLSEGMD